MTHTERRLQTRLARAETVRRHDLAAYHKSCCQKLGLPRAATDRQINDEFARRLAQISHRCEREQGLLPVLRPATLDDLDTLDKVTFLARVKATLVQDGYLPCRNPGDTP